jgi:hypothetical protein
VEFKNTKISLENIRGSWLYTKNLDVKHLQMQKNKFYINYNAGSLIQNLVSNNFKQYLLNGRQKFENSTLRVRVGDQKYKIKYWQKNSAENTNLQFLKQMNLADNT